MIDDNGEIASCSFERNEIIRFEGQDSPPLVMKSLLRDKIITGHSDGKIKVWDLKNKNIMTWQGHRQPVISLASDYQGRIYSSGLDGAIKQWDMDREQVNIVSGGKGYACHLRLYARDQVLAVLCAVEKGKEKVGHHPHNIGILNFKTGEYQMIETSLGRQLSSINVYYDGRIIASLLRSPQESENEKSNVIIIDPRQDRGNFKMLDGHTGITKDSLVAGPRIITCGSERMQNHTFKVWGTEFYVKMELSKLALIM